ncbi:hypothetical protein H2509_13405 [Stappia sp. F7233]|uniref:Uncharacterized protein n=1 Tax=Stappia albiluteola TaxID=2758565 RepID=A0A839AFB9_9HYPH|nr:hypothetical protein [Stappia albiluteola]MBA5777449.1 hypothetical protein [Stappia albiluteola]MBA5777487.1 hypothetical protein [Stappia albiluteola]MBA5778102.1 hypothetical protein [Stappia albiluteola]MBA5778121.1 hypothetical protein [Stappia albiluteola]
MSDLKTLRDQVAKMLDDAMRKAGDRKDDPAAWHVRDRNEMNNLARRLKSCFDAKISDRWDGVAVTIGGIRATSTMGLRGAVRNWVQAADRHIGAGS